MKTSHLTPVLAALAIAFSPACKKKEEPAPAEKPAAAAEATPAGQAAAPAPAPVPEAPKPSIAVAEIAAMISQAADLPKDFETLTVIDAGQIKKAFQGQPWWNDAREAMGISENDLPDAKPEPASAAVADGEPAVADGEPAAADGEPAVAGADEAMGDEGEDPVGVGTEWAEVVDMLTSGKVVFATGPETGTQTMELLKLINLFQRMSVKQSLVTLAEQYGLMEGDEDMMMGNPFGSLFKDRFDPLLAGLEKMQPPVVFISLEAKGKEDKVKEILAEWDSTISGDLPPFVEKKELELGGGKFLAFTIKAADMISLDDMKESMAEELSAEQIEKLHAVIAQKTLTFGFGVRNESMVLFLAPLADSLKFAASPEESMAARPELEMLGEAKGKNPFFISMAAREVGAGLRQGSDAGYLADVLKEVLGEIKVLGDLRDVVALVEKSGQSLRDLTKGTDTPFCSIGWLEDGVRFEALGGADSPDLDGSQPLAFAGNLGTEDTVLTMVARSDEAYVTKALDLLEDLSEITYELGHRYASSEAGKEAGVNEQFQMFHDKMLPHVTSLWKSMRGKFGQGVGPESAFVMDLGAPIPKFPGLPEALTNGRVPRMAMVYGVTDRAALTEGWKEMEPALKGLLDAIPMPEDKKLNLPDPSTSEQESLGLKTYSYPVTGFTNDDFLPAASISDKFFFLSSSKNFSEQLAAQLAAAKPNPAAPRGLILEMRFAPVVKTALEWLALAKDNAATVFPEDMAREEFLGNEPEIRKALGYADHLESLKLSRAPEGSKWRTSIHIKTKKK